jgi:hypothetical protein
MLNEIQATQNPALGASLIWRFACGYCEPENATEGVFLPLIFLVLPMLLHEETRNEISSTRAGLHKFEEKYKDKYDVLLSIQDRALAMRELSRKSLAIAIASGLITLVPDDGTVWPERKAPPSDLAASTRELLKSAEKIGNWAREVSLFELTRILRMEL